MSCDLYRFYDLNNRLLYVGISLHAAQRASDHRGNKPWWSDVARMEVEHLKSRRDALRAESAAIREERPIYNVAHSRPRIAVHHEGVTINRDRVEALQEMYTELTDDAKRWFAQLVWEGNRAPTCWRINEGVPTERRYLLYRGVLRLAAAFGSDSERFAALRSIDPALCSGLDLAECDVRGAALFCVRAEALA